MSVNVGKAVAYLDIDTSRFKTGLSGAVSDLKKFGDSSKSTGDRLSGLSGAMKTTGAGLTKYVTTPLAGVGAASLKTAAEFEKQMARVKSISGATGKDFQALQAKAKEMGATTIFTSKDAADAMEYMGMAGWKADQMIAGLPGIMDLAAASGEELGTVSDIVTDALTGFGLKAEDTTRFVDVLAAAATNSNTSVSLMGETFKYAAPVAGALGYSIEDVAVATGLMANSGIKASQAGTSLRSLMTNLAKPTGESAKAVEALDLSLTDSAGNMKSFKDIMDELRAKFGELKMPQQEVEQKQKELNDALEAGTITQAEYDKGMEELMKNAFGVADAEKAKNAAMLVGKTGMSGLLAILNATDEDYKKLTDSIYGSAGASKEMADIQRDTLWGSMELLKSAISAVAQSIGERLIPHVRATAEWITKLVDKFNGLSEGQKDAIVNFGLFIAKLGPALLIGSKVVDMIAKLANTLSTVKHGVDLFLTGFGKIIPMFTNVGSGAAKLGGLLIKAFTFNPIITAIAAVIAILVTLWFKCEGFRDFVKGLIDFFKELPGKIVGFFEGLPESIGNVIEGLKKTVSDKIKSVRDAVSGVFDNIQGWGEGLVDSFDEAFWPFTEDVYNKVTDWGSDAKQWFWDASENAVGGLKDVFLGLGSFFEGLSTTLGSVWQFITDGASGVVGAIVKLVTFNPAGAFKELKTMFNLFKTRDLDKLKEGFEEMKAGIGKSLSGLKKMAKEKLDDVAGFIKDTFGIDVGGFFKGVGEKFNDLKKTAKEKLGEAADKVKGLGDKIMELNKNVSGNLPETFRSVFTEIIPGFFDDVATKAGEVGESIKEFFSKSPEEMGYAIGQAAGNIVNFFLDAGEKLTTFIVETIPQKWEEFMLWIDESVGSFFEKAGEKIKEVGQTIGEFFASIPEKVGELVTKFDEWYTMFDEWFGNMLERLGYWIGELLANVYLFFTEDIPEILDKFFNETLPNVIEKVSDFFEDIGENISEWWDGLLDDFSKWWDNLWKGIEEFGEKAKKWVLTEVPKMIDNAVKFFSELPGKIRTELKKAYDVFVKWGNDLLKKAGEVGSKAVEDVVKFFKELPGKVEKAIDKAYVNVTNWGNKMIKKAGEIAKKFKDDFVKFFKELPGKITDYVKSIPEKIGNMKDKFVNAGKKLIDGLLGGLKGAWEGVERWLKDIANNIGKFFGGIQQGFTNTINSRRSSTYSVDGSHAEGLDYVPYDGYIAELHQGERVLTRAQNAQLKTLGRSNTGFVGQIKDNLSVSLEDFISDFRKMFVDLSAIIVTLSVSVERFSKSLDETSLSLKKLGETYIGSSNYVPYGMVTESKTETEVTEERDTSEGVGTESRGGDTFIFYDTKDEPYEYYRNVKKAKRELEYGF